MSNITRDYLIKVVVAEEMIGYDGPDYSNYLKQMYHKWEHESSDALCKRYNSLKNTNLTVDVLTP